jgi:hypothetical protein
MAVLVAAAVALSELLPAVQGTTAVLLAAEAPQELKQILPAVTEDRTPAVEAGAAPTTTSRIKAAKAALEL